MSPADVALGWLGGTLLAAMLAAGLAAYAWVIQGHLDVVAAALDKQALVEEATGFWSRLSARLLGWKTVILAGVATLAQVLGSPDVAAALTSVHWETVLDQRTANLVSLVCTLLIPLTHAVGLAKAATTPPAE